MNASTYAYLCASRGQKRKATSWHWRGMMRPLSGFTLKMPSGSASNWKRMGVSASLYISTTWWYAARPVMHGCIHACVRVHTHTEIHRRTAAQSAHLVRLVVDTAGGEVNARRRYAQLGREGFHARWERVAAADCSHVHTYWYVCTSLRALTCIHALPCWHRWQQVNLVAGSGVARSCHR